MERKKISFWIRNRKEEDEFLDKDMGRIEEDELPDKGWEGRR